MKTGTLLKANLKLIVALTLAAWLGVLVAATIKPSGEPRTTTISTLDDIFLTATNSAAGTNNAFKTKRISWGDLLSAISANPFSSGSFGIGKFGSIQLTNQAYLIEQLWGGPTNSISGSNGFYYYVNLVNPSLAITDIVQGVYSPSSFQLRIFENSGSNATVYLPAGAKTPDGSSTFVATNGLDTFVQIWKGDRSVVRHETDYNTSDPSSGVDVVSSVSLGTLVNDAFCGGTNPLVGWFGYRFVAQSNFTAIGLGRYDRALGALYGSTTVELLDSNFVFLAQATVGINGSGAMQYGSCYSNNAQVNVSLSAGKAYHLASLEVGNYPYAYTVFSSSNTVITPGPKLTVWGPFTYASCISSGNLVTAQTNTGYVPLTLLSQ